MGHQPIAGERGTECGVAQPRWTDSFPDLLNCQTGIPLAFLACEQMRSLAFTPPACWGVICVMTCPEKKKPQARARGFYVIVPEIFARGVHLSRANLGTDERD